VNSKISEVASRISINSFKVSGRIEGLAGGVDAIEEDSIFDGLLGD
jgi:hypothetical protein